MDTPFLPEIVMKNIDPEVTSFIYQTIAEFENYSTPETVVHVVAKNPLELLHLESEELTDAELPGKSKLKKMFRIEISLTDEGTTLSAEGLDSDIYVAIKKAKDRLLDILGKIQDDVISNQDRNNEIRSILAAGGSVH